MPATLTRRTALPALTEAYVLTGDGGSPLKIDEEAGIIYGCKIGGRFSPNCHRTPGVTEGTEYTRAAYKGALGLYENRRVYSRHDDPSKRGPFDHLGVIRNARYDDVADCPRGDFHYRKTHPDAAQLIEDVKRGMGGFGFSHHIPQGGYTGAVKNGRLVIDSIKEISSVDLVAQPATTRNLWESQERPVKTVKAILEAWVAPKSAAFKACAKPLLEDDMPMAAPVDAPADGATADPEDELWSGFQSAIMAIINGDGDATEKAKKVAQYLKAHEKLTGDKDPGPDDKPAEDPPPADAAAKESRELRAENACLKAGIADPPKSLVKALGLLESQADRDALIAGYKPAGPARTGPKSGAPGARPRTDPATGRPLTEAVQPKTRAEFLSSIRG